MLKYKNLILVGTSHIAKQSIKQVKEVIGSETPDVIAIELDKKRLMSVMSEQKGSIRFKDIFRIGIKGWLFAVLGAWAEHKLGKIVKTKPGGEMNAAIALAGKTKTPLALIDQDIEITLKRLSRSIKFIDYWHFFIDAIKAVVLRTPAVQFDLNTVPDKKIIKQLTGEVKKRYPGVYKVLIADRNRFMARKLALLHSSRPDDKIVAVIGAGHEDEILELYKKYIKIGY